LAQLDYAVHTHGEGPSVLWLHGYTMNSAVWPRLWDALPGWRHVGLDLPGHGASAALRPGMSLPELAADIAEVCRREQAHRVVALSFGSMIALQLAIDHPALVRNLVLAAPTIAGRPAEPGTGSRYRELYQLYSVFGAGEHLTDTWMKSPPDIFLGTERHPDVRAHLREIINQHRWEELRTNSMHALTAHPHREQDLAGIQAHTLVLTGTEDMPTFHENAVILRRTVARCETRQVPDTGHLCLLEAPEPVAPHVDVQLRADQN
jgi:3-oxoadipate enol-lactonase